MTRLETASRDTITVAEHGTHTTRTRKRRLTAASSSIGGFRPTASLHAPIAGSVRNSTAALQAVHAPSASATRSGWPIEAAMSTPGSACVVTALTEIRLKSAAYSESRCHLCSPVHTTGGMGGGGGCGGSTSSGRLVRAEHKSRERRTGSLMPVHGYAGWHGSATAETIKMSLHSSDAFMCRDRRSLAFTRNLRSMMENERSESAQRGRRT